MNHGHAMELVPLYALDALEGQELADVASHIDSCDVCSAELARYLAVSTALVPDSPAPSHVWAHIEDGLASNAGADVIQMSPPASTSSNAWRWVLGAAAGLALVFGGFVVGQSVASNQLNSGEAVVAAAERASNEPGSFVADFFVDDVVVAQVVVTTDGSGYLIPSDGLATIDDDRTYQLWVITPEELVISAGVLGNDPRPATFTWSEPFAGFALSREVAGGVVSSEGDIISVSTEA